MRTFLTALIALATAAQAAPIDHATGWTSADIPWQSTATNGTRYALLEGTREKAGTPFSYAFAIPAGMWDGPHWHSATARIFVAKGVLNIGYGPTIEKAHAKAYPVGSYVVVPAGAVHFDGSEEDTVIIGTAVGPWSANYLDGSSPASAGTPRRQ